MEYNDESIYGSRWVPSGLVRSLGFESELGCKESCGAS